MKLRTMLAALVALALAVTPTMALAGQPEDPGGLGEGKGPHYTPEVPTPKPPQTPGPQAPLPEQAKAYGVYCQGKSREHVDGEPGTAFSRCVNTMARLATHDNLTPREACKKESRKHAKGEKGTAFSRCVVAAAKFKRQQREEEQQS